MDQMEFSDVVESEHLVGDQVYTAWVAAGRPALDRDVAAAEVPATP